jgi:hypothetical protein
MLNSISWKEYFTIVILIGILYYLIIGYLYFKWEILGLFGIKLIQSENRQPIDVSEFRATLKKENNEDYLPKPMSEPDITPVIQTFTNEVQAYFQAIAGQHKVKEEVLFALQQIAGKYPTLKASDLREALEEFTYTESKKYLSVLLEPESVKNIWVL